MIGEVRGGYCERLLAQFVCDVITWGVKQATRPETNIGFDTSEGYSLRNNFNQVNERLKARYGNIINNRYGLTSQDLVHKACIAAITGDWSDLQTVFKEAGRVPVAPVIGPMIPESRFNAYDPFTGKAQIIYYYTLGILSGGQRITGNVRIMCDPHEPGGEYCPPDRQVTLHQEAIYVDPSGSIQRNVQVLDDYARWWGNVVVLELQYQE